jgi:unsaturated chondroitin disaccharide hydrolase
MTDIELLDFSKKKIDMIMEKIDPRVNIREAGNEIDGKYTNRMLPVDVGGWTHSFLTGMIAYMYFHYKEQKYLDFLYGLFDQYKKYIYDNLAEVGHDTGFVYSLYAVALYKITGDLTVRELALKAADELAKRHHYESGVLLSFCSLKEDKAIAIADDNMNLHLIMWAQSETDHPFYERVLKKHIQATIDYMIREDYTVRHAYAFDKKTGAPLTEKNWCGYSCGSAWARGMAWTIYGMNSVIHHTNDLYAYLPSLNGMSNRFIREIEKDDMVPVWDFKIPHYAEQLKDSSAAAIVASAFYSAARDIPEKEREGQFKHCGDISDKIFEALVDKYLAPVETENILTKGQCGYKNSGCLWGDYFFVELLMKRIHGDEAPNFWI